MGKLKEWLDEDWVRIDSSGNIVGECGTSKIKKTLTDAFLAAKLKVLAKVKELLQRVKKSGGSKGKTVVSNTKAAKVRRMRKGGSPGIFVSTKVAGR